jgi:ankyrin repeat protein
MKRSASSAFKPVSAGYRSATPFSTRQDSDVAGNADVTGSTASEENQHAIAAGPGHTKLMPFPGPYAHDAAPAVLARFGPADDVAVPAPTTTSGVTEASSTATTSVVHGNVPAAHHDQPLPSDGRETDFDGLPPLLLAAKRGNLDQLRKLLEQPGVNLDQVDDRSGANALMAAAQAGNLHVVEFLLASGVDVNFKSRKSGLTALICAAGAGKLEAVKILLKCPGVRLEPTGNNGVCALAGAAYFGHADIVNALLDAGADVNFRHPKNGNTALMLACAEGRLDVVNVLIKRPGIRLEQTNNNGVCALFAAAHQGNADIVGRLVDAGADMTAPNVRGQSCLHPAIAKRHANVVECLLARGAPLPDPLAMLPAGSRNMISLSDLFLDRKMPAASPDNPLHLTDPHLLDDHHRFFQALVATLNPDADGNVNKALADWFAAQGIRHAVGAPIMHSLGDLSKVWRLLAAPGQAGPTAQQKLAYCVSRLSRLGLLVPDQKIAAPYLQASLSAAGVDRLSQLAIAQRDKLVTLAEVATAQLASDMLDRLATDCIASSGVGFRVDFDADALMTSMINTGFVAPLAKALVNSWHAALEQLTAIPLAMPQMLSMTEMMPFIHDRVATEGPKLFVREILRQLDTQALITEWRNTLGDTGAEGLFALFDDQCRQLRQYCEQMGANGA